MPPPNLIASSKPPEQPGSIFKPIVYAAALETAFDREIGRSRRGEGGADGTGVTQLQRARRQIPPKPKRIARRQRHHFDNYAGRRTDHLRIRQRTQTYEPNNYHQEYRGTVTVRTALRKLV